MQIIIKNKQGEVLENLNGTDFDQLEVLETGKEFTKLITVKIKSLKSALELEAIKRNLFKKDQLLTLEVNEHLLEGKYDCNSASTRSIENKQTNKINYFLELNFCLGRE